MIQNGEDGHPVFQDRTVGGILYRWVDGFDMSMDSEVRSYGHWESTSGNQVRVSPGTFFYDGWEVELREGEEVLIDAEYKGAWWVEVAEEAAFDQAQRWNTKQPATVGNA